MKSNIFEQALAIRTSRRALLQGGAGIAGGALLSGGMVLPVYAEDHPAIGTYPAGSSGNSVFIGASVPRTGTYDTTGKDCVRYGFRQNFFGRTAAAAIAPVLIKEFGKNKKVAYMTPDYTYGHTVTKSMPDMTAAAGWTTVTNQVSPLGVPDFSSYLLNVANSGADVLINVNWGHDAVLSTQQAQRFGILDKMKLVVPYQIPFLAPEVGNNLTAGVYAATDFWWTLQDQYPLAKMFVETFE